MKKIINYLSIVMIALTSLTLTSCDEDAEIAYALDGTWKGTLVINGKSYLSYCRFIQEDYHTYGYGYEVNESKWGNTSRYRFTWKINKGNIYINYDDGYKVVIYDFNERYLSHGVLDGIGTDTLFGEDTFKVYLTKISDNIYD